MQKFTRGQDPKTAMNIGKRVEIIKWFSDLNISPDRYEIDDKLNITVNGMLDLAYVKELPDNLTVKGSLHADYVNITKLSNNLTIEGNLYFSTSITELPKDLVVKGTRYKFK